SQGAPMGGMKDSGLGRRHGDESLLKLTESQNVATQRVLGFDPPFGISAETYAGLMTRSMTLMKRVRLR
nr:succinic semialdehyde dehydrogenase [Micromonospora sp. DSM 115978]